ncbi:hypothetical protein [Krasilnikoviella flava]|uniref:Uncharacterized protein n=1 Tax=Krasilnikoviella flava TaxID=526729 RepID=A0A1T5L6W6_9MICO|nr:hypothetical protein [Krasilnikoviella flava]SKC71684.1 hypothetical protein SAMN04324258_3034 [Krasilnikoviella flava]
MTRSGRRDEIGPATGTVSRRVEFVATVLLALATVVTAWSAFQSTKWSGVQANSYAAAGAARAESTRASTEAGQLTIMDVTAFASWIDAVAAETRAGKDSGLGDDGSYEPVDGTGSEFLYTRFRPEMVPAFDAWLAADPLHDDSAPRTPFLMPQYRLEAQERADAGLERAEDLSATARQANQTGDNYVLTSILFASVALFAALSTKLVHRTARRGLLGVAVVLFVVSTVVVLTFPKEL